MHPNLYCEIKTLQWQSEVVSNTTMKNSRSDGGGRKGGGTTWLKNSIVGGSVRGAACLLLPPCRTVEAAALPSPHPSFNSPLYEQKFSLTFHISFYWAPLCSSSPANGRMFYLIHRLTNKKAGRNAFIFLYYIKYVCRILCFWLSAESWNCFAHRLESGACA